MRTGNCFDECVFRDLKKGKRTYQLEIEKIMPDFFYWLNFNFQRPIARQKCVANRLKIALPPTVQQDVQTFVRLNLSAK